MINQVKRSFLAAVAVFELGSLVCAVAPTSTSLIIGRALAGVGDGAIFAGAYTILASTGTGPPIILHYQVAYFLKDRCFDKLYIHECPS